MVVGSTGRLIAGELRMLRQTIETAEQARRRWP
jgi:hypothetical protein